MTSTNHVSSVNDEPTNTVAPPAPKRLSSLTNLTRDEALWRSSVLDLRTLDVILDLRRAQDPSISTFCVTSRLRLTLPQRVERGLWVDFLGSAIDEFTIDGVAQSIFYDSARLVLPPLDAGDHEFIIRGTGRFSNTGQGLHRFRDPVDGATYLYTHFEPSDARRAWPCIDQPDVKAPFSLSVLHPEGWTILSNTEGTLSDPTRTDFAPSRPLPSYLTACAAGPWHREAREWTQPSTGEQITLSWSCRQSLAEHLDAETLLDLTEAGMDFYDATYDYPYPWGAYDSVLVPEYNLGAMENPGCVTFNEEAYLFQGPVTDAQRASRANTIMHEMCHMWFGDLVTPRWWEDTWLKESFADHQGTWVKGQATRYTDTWVTFAFSRKGWAYAEDMRPATTHPIVATVDDVEAARQAFDGITYAKGASVLKQLVAYLGEDVFLDACRHWFHEHAFGNGELSEFLDMLGRVSGRDMTAWADAWLHTAGASILTADYTTSSTPQGEVISRMVLSQDSTDLYTGVTCLRPHTLVLGLYYRDGDGALTRQYRLSVTLSTAQMEIPEAAGLPVPDLVVINDEDLTYAITRPDTRSLDTLLNHLSDLADPMAVALSWSMLHNLVRDGLLPARDFVQAVVEHVHDGYNIATMTALLDQAQHVATHYSTLNQRHEVFSPLCSDLMWDMLQQSQPGGGHQLVRARAFISASANAALVGSAAVDVAEQRLRSLLAGDLEGLELSHDLRWRIMVSLSAMGRLSVAELEAQHRADRSNQGRMRFLTASHAAPTVGAKERIWDCLMETDQSLSNDSVDALLAAWNISAHHELVAAFTQRYTSALMDLWSNRSQEMASRLVTGLFPDGGDARDLDVINQWLNSHTGAPAALRRLVLKSRDDLTRSLHARSIRKK